MWLHQYLDLWKSKNRRPNSSLEAIVIWEDVGGLRESIINSTNKYLSKLANAYNDKFERLPNNFFTRATLVGTGIISPLGVALAVAVDGALISTLAGAFMVSWAVAGAASFSISSACWIVSGSSTSNVFDKCIDVSEAVIFTGMRTLSVPASVVSSVGIVAATGIELAADGVSYGLVSGALSLFEHKRNTASNLSSNSVNSVNSVNSANSVSDTVSARQHIESLKF